MVPFVNFGTNRSIRRFGPVSIDNVENSRKPSACAVPFAVPFARISTHGRVAQAGNQNYPGVHSNSPGRNRNLRGENLNPPWLHSNSRGENLNSQGRSLNSQMVNLKSRAVYLNLQGRSLNSRAVYVNSKGSSANLPGERGTVGVPVLTFNTWAWIYSHFVFSIRCATPPTGGE